MCIQYLHANWKFLLFPWPQFQSDGRNCFSYAILNLIGTVFSIAAKWRTQFTQMNRFVSMDGFFENAKLLFSCILVRKFELNWRIHSKLSIVSIFKPIFFFSKPNLSLKFREIFFKWVKNKKKILLDTKSAGLHFEFVAI